jgi:hypothetical protein
MALSINVQNEKSDGTDVYNGFSLVAKKDGSKAVEVTDAGIWRSAIGAAASSHTHNYLPLSGGTITGALHLANNVLNGIGDDAYLGDVNQAGKIGIKGKNGATGFYFQPYSGSTAQSLSIDGAGTMTISGTVTASSSLKASDGYLYSTANGNTVQIGSQNGT